MVYAKPLSEEAILEGVERGNVYLKTRGKNGPDILFQVISEDKSWLMGGYNRNKFS